METTPHKKNYLLADDGRLQVWANYNHSGRGEGAPRRWVLKTNTK